MQHILRQDPPTDCDSLRADSDDSSTESRSSLGSLQNGFRNGTHGEAEDEDDDGSSSLYESWLAAGPDGPPADVEAARAAYMGADQDGFDEQMRDGVTYFLVEKEFMQNLYAWFEDKGERPMMPIDNSSLFARNSCPRKLRGDLIEKEDYMIVTRAQWDTLVAWFGGGPAIARDAYVSSQGAVKIDVRGVDLSVARPAPAEGEDVRVVVTRDVQVGRLKRQLCEKYFPDLDPKNVRLVHPASQGRLTPANTRLESFGLEDEDRVVVELVDPEQQLLLVQPPPLDGGGDAAAGGGEDGDSVEGGWRLVKPPPTLVDAPKSGNRITQFGRPPVRGAVGLQNLGNTCFMNSTLQCLSNLPALRAHFASRAFEREVNEHNVLGTKGRLARSFGDLVGLMWGSASDAEQALAVSPVETRQTIVAKKAVFQGYHQHDSQELLIFILDILHEDLNRVRDKPQTLPVESDGNLPDDAVFRESQRVFRLRNDSFVNDLTESFLKSTVVCPDPACKRVSVRFDQCTCLTLPVSRPQERAMCVCMIRVFDCTKGARAMRERMVQLRVPVDATFGHLRADLAAQMRVDMNELFLGAVYNSELVTSYVREDDCKLNQLLKGDEVYAYYHPGFAAWRLEHVWAKLAGQWRRTLDWLGGEGGGSDLPDLCPINRGEARVHVTEVSVPGPFLPLMGVFVKCVLDRKESVRGPESCVQLTGTLVDGTGVLSLESVGPGGLQRESIRGRLDPGAFVDPGSSTLLTRFRQGCPPPAGARLSLIRMSAEDSSGTRIGPDYVLPLSADVRSGADVKAVVDSGLRLRAEAAELAWPVKWRLQWRALGMGLDEDPGEDWRACEPGPMVRLGVVWDKQALAELGRDAQEALAGDGYRQPSASLTGAAGGGAEQGAVGLSIYECLDLFSQEEQLSASDAWYCPGCNTHKEAFKKFQVWSLAPVLVVHLKRFSQAEASYWVDKDDAFVDYPLEGLDLTSRVAGRAPGETFVYDLAAVSHHFGGLGGGHYIATARNELDGKWYEFDDSTVRLVGDTCDEARHRVCAASGYVLFYVRRDMRPKAWGEAP